MKYNKTHNKRTTKKNHLIHTNYGIVSKIAFAGPLALRYGQTEKYKIESIILSAFNDSGSLYNLTFSLKIKLKLL